MVNKSAKIKKMSLIGLSILLLISGNLNAQENALIYSNTNPPDNAANVYGIVPMMEELKSIIPMKLVPGSQLFDSRTALSSIGGGIAGAGEVISSYSRSDLKHAVILNDLMYLGRNELVVNAAATETLLRNCPNCMKDYAESNTLFLSGAAAGSYGMLCKSEVTNVSQMSGKKFRAVSASRRWVRALGGIPVSLSINDMVEGLSRGLVDCIVGPIAWLKSFPIADDVKFIYAYNVGAFSFATMVINRGVWDDFNATQKHALWNAQSGVSARTVVRLYVAEAIQARMIAKEKGIPITTAGQDIENFWQEFKKDEAATVNKVAGDLGAKNPKEISDNFIKNIEKWEKIIASSGLANLLTLEEIDEDILHSAEVEYEELLQSYIYDKINPEEL
ncbi:MAG: hypothetical protein HOH19_08400 [Kordiimonadaceae bacterium]|nr:hypothetical protein [Kordiimonadaceae bacterium]